MTDSIFTRVFSYRQRDNLSPLENFITEIFAFCIKYDEAFRNDFFRKLLSINLDKSEFNVSTQEEYYKFGRPDIEITFNNTAILFECKVEANERRNQLNDYASILTLRKTTFTDHHIVFLTKYFEHKELEDKKVKLHLIRWFEVNEIINENHNEVTLQLQSFLKEHEMEKVKNFTIQDLLAMKTISETISKMDELLEHFKPEFELKFGGYSKESSRSTRLPNNCYVNFVTLSYQKIDYWLLVGFDWDYEDEIPYLALTIEIQKKKFEGSDLIKILENELLNEEGWEIVDYGSVVHYSALKPITDFISQEEDNIPTMRKYIQENLNILYELQKKYPQFLIRRDKT